MMNSISPPWCRETPGSRRDLRLNAAVFPVQPMKDAALISFDDVTRKKLNLTLHLALTKIYKTEKKKNCEKLYTDNYSKITVEMCPFIRILMTLLNVSFML